MVQEVRIVNWCDKHNAEGERVQAQTYVLSIGELREREIDLCHDCQEELLGAAFEWLQKVGRPVVGEAAAKPRRKKKDEAQAAPVQGPAQSGEFLFPVDTRLALEAESRKNAGRPRNPSIDENPNQPQWRAAREGGFPCPMCDMAPPTDGALKQHLRNHHDLTPKQTFGERCPVCAQDFPVLGAHAKMHEQATLWHLFQEAVRLGDPHGVVTERQVTLWNRPFLLAA